MESSTEPLQPQEPKDPLAGLIAMVDDLHEIYVTERLRIPQMVTIARAWIITLDEVIENESPAEDEPAPQRLTDLIVAHDIAQDAIADWRPEWAAAIYEQLLAGTVFLKCAMGE